MYNDNHNIKKILKPSIRRQRVVSTQPYLLLIDTFSGDRLKPKFNRFMLNVTNPRLIQQLQNAKEIDNLLSEFRLIASGKEIQEDLNNVLIMAMQSGQWDHMSKLDQVNLSFRMLKLNELFVKLDDYR
jgi:hypothetical protein